jgi:hypothetical protein
VATLAQPGKGLLTGLLQGVLAVTEVLGDPVGDVRRDLNPLDHGAQQVRELLLTDVRIPASAPEAGTPVVGVLAFRLLKQIDLCAIREFRTTWDDGAVYATKNLERMRARSSDSASRRAGSIEIRR